MMHDQAKQDELKQSRDFLGEAIQWTMRVGTVAIIAALTVAYIYVLTK